TVKILTRILVAVITWGQVPCTIGQHVIRPSSAVIGFAPRSQGSRNRRFEELQRPEHRVVRRTEVQHLAVLHLATGQRDGLGGNSRLGGTLLLSHCGAPCCLEPLRY